MYIKLLRPAAAYIILLCGWISVGHTAEFAEPRAYSTDDRRQSERDPGNELCRRTGMAFLPAEGFQCVPTTVFFSSLADCMANCKRNVDPGRSRFGQLRSFLANSFGMKSVSLYGSGGELIGGPSQALTVGAGAAAASVLVYRAFVAITTSNPAVAAFVVPLPRRHAFQIDTRGLGVSAAQVRNLIDMPADQQNRACGRDEFRRLCSVLGEINFQMALANGDGV